MNTVKKKKGAPLGNKFALGCTTNGRPREHDRLAIAQEMLEWSKLEDSINLCGFCCSREPPISPTKITDWARECKDFREAYETVKAQVGYRRERLLTENKLHVKAYDLNAKTYDHFMKTEAQLEARAKLELDKELADHKANLLKQKADELGVNLYDLAQKLASGQIKQLDE